MPILANKAGWQIVHWPVIILLFNWVDGVTHYPAWVWPMPSGTFLENVQARFGWYTGQEPFPEGRMDEVTMPRRKGGKRVLSKGTQPRVCHFPSGLENWLCSLFNSNVPRETSSQIVDFFFGYCKLNGTILSKKKKKKRELRIKTWNNSFNVLKYISYT